MATSIMYVWQIKRAGWVKEQAQRSYANQQLWAREWAPAEAYEAYWGAQHRYQVGNAVECGKPVPADVLADYPEFLSRP